MGGRITQFLGHLKDIGDRTTQLTLLSISIVVILVAAVFALPAKDAADLSGSADGSTSGTGIAGEGGLSGGEGPLSGGAAGSGTRSSGRVSGPDGTGSTGVGVAGKPPITATEVKVGIAYLEDPESANAAAGFQGIGQVDQKRAWDAMIADINRDPPHGRKVVPVYYSATTDELTSKGGERVEQEACAHYTQDNKVFAVWDGIIGQETINSCLTKAGVPEVGGSGGLSWSKTYKDFPYVIEPTGAAMDRLGAFEIDQLYSAGYFSGFKRNDAPYEPQRPADGKPRIGLIRYDQPSFKAGAAAMKRRLAAHGLSLCSGCEFEIAYSSDNIPEQLNDAGEVNAAIQSFKSKGVTHVLLLGSTAGGRITLFFIDGAEKQGYRPRLGFNQLDLVTLVRDFHGESSYPQFADSVLVTTLARDFETHTPAYARCKALFEKAGETFGGDDTSGNKEAQITLYCDTAWYFRAVLEAAGRSLSLESFMNGVHNVAPVPSADTFLMHTKPGRHDGAGAVKIGKWADACHCFKAASGEIPV